MRRFKEIKYTTYNNNLKNDIKILHISDIHYINSKDNKLLDRLYNKFNKNKFDYILITGDIVDLNEALFKNDKYIKDWLIKMSNIGNLIISFGNHDIYRKVRRKPINEFNKLFWNDIAKQKNIHILDNNSYEDKNIFVYGYNPSISYYFKRENKSIMLKELDSLNIGNNLPNKYKICLIHTPMFLDDKDISLKLKNYDLILSGHMHNGLMPPILDEIFNNTIGIISRDKQLFSKMTRGFVKNNNLIVISSGINKLHSKGLFIISLFNYIYPIGYNVISVKNKKCKFTNTYKYTR